VPALNTLASATLAGGRTIGDAVHIVHLYVVEPHPQAPDPSPYSGAVSEAQYSTKRQPRTYADREAAARDMLPFVTGRQRIVIDDLSAGAVNPVWCTYGTCPNCAFLIRQDGTIDAVQTWFEPDAMERAILALVAR
jgi:hypothetical protein